MTKFLKTNFTISIKLYKKNNYKLSTTFLCILLFKSSSKNSFKAINAKLMLFILSWYIKNYLKNIFFAWFKQFKNTKTNLFCIILHVKKFKIKVFINLNFSLASYYKGPNLKKNKV